MQVPDIQECTRMMEQYKMLANIRHHSLVVARIADVLVAGLQGNIDYPLPDRQLCISGALLHDIAKTPCLDDSCDHARAGAEICREHGYPEIAAIVAQHVILEDYDQERYCRGEFSALEIVYYADKRVRHDNIVSLEERLVYILDRYSRNNSELQEVIRYNFQRCVQLEDCLFKFLHFIPEDLAQQIHAQAE